MTSRPVLWSIGQQVGRQAASLLVFAVLAGLLSPKDLGVVAMAGAWLGFIAVFSELGLGVALIQREELEPRHLNSTFAVNLALGVVLCICGIALSWPFAFVFRTPEVQPVAAVLSLGFMINAFSFTPTALAQRELRFRHLATRDLTASLAGGFIGISLAGLGRGVWSLVAQSLTASIVGAVLIWHYSRWTPRLTGASWASIRELWPYSSRILSFNVLKFFVQNADQLLIGYLLGSVALGTYAFATKALLVPVSTLMAGFGGYLFPRFAQLQQSASLLRRTYLSYFKVINSLVLPASTAAAFLAPVVLPLVFGRKWLGAVPIIQVLSAVAVSQSFFGPVGELMKALGHADWLLRWSVFSVSITAVGLWIGSRWGMIGCALGLACAYAISIPVVYSILTRLVPLRWKEMQGALLSPLLSTLALGATLSAALSLHISSPLVRTLIAVVSGLTSYCTTLLVIDRPFVIELLRQFARR